MTRIRLAAATAGVILVALVAPPVMATEINQQEFITTGACVQWTNDIDAGTSESWVICAEVEYESRLFGAVEKTVADAWAYHELCVGWTCSWEGFGEEIDPADVALDADNNVTGVHTTMFTCGIDLSIAGTGEDVYYEESYAGPVDTDVVTLQRYHDIYSGEGAVGTGTACGWEVVAERASDSGGRGQSSHNGLALRIHDGQ